jgi:hypothetical protein
MFVIAGGMLLGGWQLATAAAPIPASKTIIRHGTEYRTRVRTVKRVTRGRVITLPGGTRVVHVPLIIIHTDHKTIRVPAHNLPFRRVAQGGDLQAATVAEPLVPVTVTVYVPSDPVTVTSVVTTTETVTTWIPTTITVPPPETSGPSPDS